MICMTNYDSMHLCVDSHSIKHQDWASMFRFVMNTLIHGIQSTKRRMNICSVNAVHLIPQIHLLDVVYVQLVEPADVEDFSCVCYANNF